jgi:hypothetical protein
MLVGFGQVASDLLDTLPMSLTLAQMICQPVGPRCDLCELPGKKLCPSARKVVNVKSRKAVMICDSLDAAAPDIEISVEEDATVLTPLNDAD